MWCAVTAAKAKFAILLTQTTAKPAVTITAEKLRRLVEGFLNFRECLERSPSAPGVAAFPTHGKTR